MTDLRALRRRFRLVEVGEPFEPGAAARLVVPAVRADGVEVVLKVTPPHREAANEAAALRFWDGGGAVRLLDEDAELGAILLERVRPGTPLGRHEHEAAAALLPQLWQPPPEGVFELVVDYTESWEDDLRHDDEALRALAWLRETEPERVVVHGDFHPGNVLRGAGGCLAIDPKPFAGERAYDAAWLQQDLPSEERLDYLARILDVNRERLRLWALVRGRWRLSSR